MVIQTFLLGIINKDDDSSSNNDNNYLFYIVVFIPIAIIAIGIITNI